MTQTTIPSTSMLSDRRGQSVVWGLLCMLIFIAVSAGLIDVYRLYAARNWAYSVAQEAALAGVSKGRDWSSVTSSGLRLDANLARSQASAVVTSSMTQRGVSGYSLDVRVLPDQNGGSISGYPPRTVRLGNGLGVWSSDEPAVGVYLQVPVKWLLLDGLNIGAKSVSVFASAGVAQ
jgi:hypothetical protein